MQHRPIVIRKCAAGKYFRLKFPGLVRHGLVSLLPEVNMAYALKIWPMLTGTIRYDKTLSTRNRGHGEFIDAPILAYLIETSNGRILYDVGCDYRKLAAPSLRARYFDSMHPVVEAPRM